MAYYGWGDFPRYVSVAERRGNGARHAALLKKQGRVLKPVATKGRGRALATTFWGRAWCDNLAAYASLLNRLERGRTYLRGGMVIDLQVLPGAVTALVSGSDIYEIAVRIKPMPEPRWKAVVKACAGKIDSVVELLAGRFDESVMAHVCRQGTGLFPAPARDHLRVQLPGRRARGMALQARRRHALRRRRAPRRGPGAPVPAAPRRPRRPHRPRHRRPDAATGPSKRSSRRAIASDRLSTVFGIELEAAPAPRARRPAGKPRSR